MSLHRQSSRRSNRRTFSLATPIVEADLAAVFSQTVAIIHEHSGDIETLNPTTGSVHSADIETLNPAGNSPLVAGGAVSPDHDPSSPARRTPVPGETAGPIETMMIRDLMEDPMQVSPLTLSPPQTGRGVVRAAPSFARNLLPMFDAEALIPSPHIVRGPISRRINFDSPSASPVRIPSMERNNIDSPSSSPSMAPSSAGDEVPPPLPDAILPRPTF